MDKRTVAKRNRSSHSFAQIPSVRAQRSQFNRSHGLKTGFDSGYLIPIYADEALPGDTFNLRLKSFARLATPTKAFMDNLYLSFFFFFVPIRLIWDNFQKMMGEQTDPGDSIAYAIPQFTSETAADDSLSDYLGIPTGVSLNFNSLWHRGYSLVWNEWFRDENLQDSVVVDKDDGPDTLSDYVLLKRGKRHDYFTSCLPWTQKGDAVELDMTGYMDVIGDGTAPLFDSQGVPDYNLETAAAGSGVNWSGIKGSVITMNWEDPHLQGDLSTVDWWTVNEMREAFQVQKLLERDARGGTRYVEILRSHFGITNHPDARLQRPEYLGGGVTRMNVNPVSSTTSVSIVFGYGTSYTDEPGFVKSFTEHGILLGLVCAHADLTYQEGLDRMFSRRTRYDMYWPSLSMLGEQAVLNKEIYADGSANDDLTFGFQERYAEYRYKPSRTSGVMRSQHATSLDVWHLGLEFGALPSLNSTFIEESPPVPRVLVTSSDTQILADMWFELKCARPMPTYAVPGLIDHF